MGRQIVHQVGVPFGQDMNSYHTANSADGLRLPRSGVVIGFLADAMRLKSVLREDWGAANYKTAQRFFKGMRIEPDTVDNLLDTLVDSLVPRRLKLPEDAGPVLTLHTLIRSGIRSYAQQWDQFAAYVSSVSYPVGNHGDLAIPVLRPMLLDFGIRLGAWCVLDELRNSENMVLRQGWLGGLTVGAFIDKRRRPLRISVEEFAHKVDVSPQTVEAWRAGRSLPTAKHIEEVAKVLANGQGRGTTECVLRAVVGVQVARSYLRSICGEERIDDMEAALLLTARLTHEFLRAQVEPALEEVTSVANGEVNADKARLWELVFHGARCPAGEFVVSFFCNIPTWNKEVALDFRVLSGDWSDRTSYWLRFLGSIPEQLALARQTVDPSGQTLEEALKCVVEAQLRMSNFDRTPPLDSNLVRVSTGPEAKASSRVVQAERADCVRDFRAAVEHFRHAVRHQPQNAALHFKLGAALWQVSLSGKPADVDQSLIDEALLECRLAVQLDPEFGNARNEIGVILHNVGRHQESDLAFAQAEPYFSSYSHHWFGRGQNYVALGQLDAAKGAFEKAIERSKDSEHVPAMAFLAATLMALGETREAKRLGKKVEHRMGKDPTRDWRGILGVAGGE